MAIVQEAESAFDKLINALKQRKNQFIDELREHYDKELHALEEKESKWINKQERAEKVLEYQKSTDELKLVENAQFIVESEWLVMQV